MRWPTGKKTRDERGASAVEFALVMPLLLLILGGIFNFGLAFSQKLALDNAVRETARSAAVNTGNTQAQLQAAGVTTFNNSSIARQGQNAVLTVGSCKTTAFGTPVVATGTFRSNFMFPWLIPGIPNAIDWTSRGEYVCEFS
jgi:Flp pilus assembly protein TadG